MQMMVFTANLTCQLVDMTWNWFLHSGKNVSFCYLEQSLNRSSTVSGWLRRPLVSSVNCLKAGANNAWKDEKI